MNDINKEMKSLEKKYQAFFNSMPSVFVNEDPNRNSSIGEFYTIIEQQGSSYAFLNEEVKSKLSPRVLSEMQAIIDVFNK